MKKKLLAGLLSIGMCMALMACGQSSTPTDTQNSENTETQVSDGDDTEEITDTQDTPTETESTEDGTNQDTDTQAPSDNEVSQNLGQTLLAVFTSQLEANADATAQELADAILADPVIPFAPMTMAVEPGLLTGFGNAEITGFDEGVMFSPMIGTIPFVGYVFTLPADADIDAFAENLRANGDLNWNICTSADDMIVETNGNKVFFLMCPTALEE